MTQEQLNVLNALISFAAEHIPGGLNEDEQEVAIIVARWTIEGKVDDGEDRSSPRFEH